MRLTRILTFWFLMALVTLGATVLLAQESGSWIDEPQSPSESRRAEAARELGKSGDPLVIPVLTAAVNDRSSKVRREAVVAPSSLRVQESLDGLIAATRDMNQDVRVAAIKGLVGYYAAQGPTVAFAGLWERTWRLPKGRFVEENIRIDPGVRVESRVISALIAALNDRSAIEASREAADALGILVAQAAVPDLMKACSSSDKSLVLVALNALAKIKDPTAGPQLVNLLDSPDAEIKQEAAVTVGILKTIEALPELQTTYEDNPDHRTRQKAMEGLAYLGSPVSVPLFSRALSNQDKQIRASAAEGMARAGEKKALEELERALQAERDGDTRLAMQFAIIALGRGDFLSALVNELGSKRRGDYAHAYLVELSKNKEFLPRLYPYMDSQDSDVRSRLCTVLMFTGDQTSVRHLERQSRDPDQSVAGEALRALRSIRVRIAGLPPAPRTEESTRQQTAAAESIRKQSEEPLSTTEHTDDVVGPQDVAKDTVYVIGPEDILDVSVWKEPDISRTIPVRPDGKISLPLLNDVQAAGLTPTQLAASITEMLRKYVTQPQVTVIVTAMNSQRVYVLGEVNRPGPIFLVPNMTVLQAIATAGSLTQFANQKRIYVLRNDGGEQKRHPFNYKSALQGDTSQNIVLKPGDTIVVP